MKNNMILILLLVGVIVSCNKELVQENNTSLEGVALNEGMLVFDSESDFQNVLTNLSEGGENLNFYNEHFPDFVSSESIWNELAINEFENFKAFPDVATLVVNGGEKYVERTVDYLLLSHLTNANGMYQIGGKVFKVTYNSIYETSLESADALIAGNYSAPSITEHKITRSSSPFIQRADVSQCDNSYEHSNRDYKVSAEMSIINSWAYSEIRLNSKHRRKRWGVWIYKDVSNIEMDGSGTISQILGPDGTRGNFPYNRTESATNQAELHHLIQWCSNTSCQFQFESVSTNKARARCLDNVWRECTTSI